MSPQDDRPRVAIACQGGGSHTAFTAGVLGRLFTDDVLSRVLDPVRLARGGRAIEGD